jgi:hypothetical protein
VAFWTQADIDKLRAAISSGVLTIDYEGPPKRSQTFQSLDAMRRLLAEMRRDVNGQDTFRLAATNKGFGPRVSGSLGGGDGTGSDGTGGGF